MVNEKDQKDTKEEAQSTSSYDSLLHPDENDEDDFFERFDKMRGVSDEQLQEKEQEKTGNIELEVTKAFETLSPEDQEVFTRTNMIHFDRDVPVEHQVKRAVRLQKYNEKKRHNVIRLIILIMLIGSALAALGIMSFHYNKTHKAPVIETQEETPGVAADADALAINEASFPDAALRSFISSNIDQDKNGSLSPQERNSVLVLNLSKDARISDLTGISNFPLLQALDISNSAVSEIDVSENQYLQNLNVSGTKITSLDLSKNLELTSLKMNNTDMQEVNLPVPGKIEDIQAEGTKMECSQDNKKIFTACAYNENKQ